jgi:hypothetical protein
MDLARGGVVTGGLLMLLVGAVHVFFPRIFGWPEAFARLRAVDAKVFYTLHVALMLLAAVLGYVSLRYAEELARGEGLGGALTVMLAAFWLWRLVWQLAYFRPSRLQLARRWVLFHYGWIALFLLLTVAYSTPIAALLVG